MEQFKYYAPTKILFGKNTEAEVGELCKTQGASKVLVHFGGSSAKKSGLLDRVCGALQEAGLHYVTLGGVVPNPRLSKVYEGIEICRREKVDFILAVGGGSVIDSAKALVMASPIPATSGTTTAAKRRRPVPLSAPSLPLPRPAVK